jgi:hypothetical protein
MAEKSVDDWMLEQILQEHVAKILQDNGGSFEQAEAGSHNPKVLALFKVSAGGGVVTFMGKAIGPTEGEGRTTTAAIGEYLRANKYGFLIAAKEPDPITKLNINAEDLKLAKSGNLTAKGRVLRACGMDQTKLDAVLAGNVATGDAPAVDDAATLATKVANDDHKNNPFSKVGWNVTKQGALLRAVGPEKAAQIAASVGSRIGATSPNPNF